MSKILTSLSVDTGSLVAMAIMILSLHPARLDAQATKEETLWEDCENLDKINLTYNQPCWNPKAFSATRLGKLSLCPTEKIEGKSSVHWEVTYADLAGKENPCAMINYLYGKDVTGCEELVFSIKCETANHPPVYAMLIGAKTPFQIILPRGVMTEGWKEIRLDLHKLDVGVGGKDGKLLNYFRLFVPQDEFKAGDELSLYLDNMRMVTVDDPRK